MNKRVNDRLIQLVEVAFGNKSASDLGSMSRAEQGRLAELQQVVLRLRDGIVTAPESAVLRAISIMPKTQKRSIFSLTSPLRPVLSVRSAAEDVSYTFDDEGVHLRLSYAQVPEGWQVVGHIDPAPWLVVIGDQALETEPTGYFSATLDSREHDPIRLCRHDHVIEILPPGQSPDHVD